MFRQQRKPALLIPNTRSGGHDVTDKLHRETLKAIQAPSVQERLTTLGVDPLVLTPAELEAHVKKELSVNADLVKATGVKAN
jgi:tripartite-type tricarboxylate transporter receptor subunit TctC